MTAAARQAARTGDRSQLDRLSREADNAAASVRVLNREMKAANDTTSSTTRGFSQLATATKQWAETTIAAFVGLQGIRKVADIFRDVAKEITELRNTAKAAGTTPGDVKIFTEAIRESGEQAEGARQALVKYIDGIAQVRIKTRGFRPGQPAGVTTLRGGEGAVPGVTTLRGAEGVAQPFGGPQAIRGSVTALTSVADVVEKIRENAARFPDARRQLISGLKDLREIAKTDKTLATAVGVELFGRRYAIFAQALDKLGESGAWDKIQADLERQSRWPKDDDIERVDKYNLAVDDLGDSFEKLKLAIALPLLPNVTEGISQLAQLVENFDQIKAKYQEILDLIGAAQLEDAIVGPFRRGLTSALDAIRDFADQLPAFLAAPLKILVDTVKLSVDAITLNFSGAIRDFGTLVSDVFNAALGAVRGFSDAVIAVVDGIKRAYNSVAGLFQSKPVAEAAIPSPSIKYASGGRVPGRGTGDTVPAWLTPGEFVMRRSVVDALGADFFAGLNRGMGSLLPHSHYATGGLVADAAGGGQPVHLHLGGNSFPLNGAPAVVSALVVEAHRQHIRSAGTKPSWYGGR